MNPAAEAVFPAVLFALVAGLLAAGLFALGYSWGVIGFPLLAGGAMCALCAGRILAVLSGDAETAPAAGEGGFEPLTAASVAWVFALGAFLLALGFVLGPAAYLLAYLRAGGSSWKLSLSVAAGALLVTFGLFIRLLHVPLPVEPFWWP